MSKKSIFCADTGLYILVDKSPVNGRVYLNVSAQGCMYDISLDANDAWALAARIREIVEGGTAPEAETSTHA